MELDLVEIRTLKTVFPVFFLIFLIFPFDLAMKLLLLSGLIYFLILFFLCVGWANETNPERKFVIGFLVSVFHTFFFLFGAILAVVFVLLISKFFSLDLLKSFIKDFLKWKFFIKS